MYVDINTQIDRGPENGENWVVAVMRLLTTKKYANCQSTFTEIYVCYQPSQAKRRVASKVYVYNVIVFL
jgi:hypothetical protein